MRELLLKRKSRFALYIFACFFPVVSDLMRIGVFALLFEAIDRLDKDFFITVIFIACGSVVVGFLLQVASRLLRISYMRDTILDVRLAGFDKIISTPYKQFRKKSKDVYISNLVNDINTFEKEFFINLLNFIYSSGLYLFSLVILLFIDLYLGLAIFSVSILIFFLSKKFEKKTVSLQKEVSNENEKFTLEMSNVFNGIEILKLNNMDKKFLSKSYDSIDHMEKNKYRFRVFSESQRSFTQTIAQLVFVGTLLYLLTRVQNGLSYGGMALLIQLSNNLVFPLTNIFPRLNVIKASKAIFDKITTKEEESTNGHHKTEDFVFNHQIEVRDLFFQYEDKQVLHNASFTIEKGKKYLIKGPSGAGKSTLMKLLSMTYDDYEGDIWVDGCNYKTVNENSFNDRVAFVYQDVFLFEDSLKNNITLYKEMDEKKIRESIEKAGLATFVDEKTNGIYDAISENGKNLSGGERQRISIARAIVKDAEILFIDEGTSALNEELGKEIEQTFLSLDNTVLSISHRYYPGVTEMYDYVIEIKDGAITTYESKNYFGEVSYV